MSSPSARLEEVYNCIHCGVCLAACPTYELTGLETESPRGRIHLSRALYEGRINPSYTFTRHIYTCLGCRACETVCPAGVNYGTILEGARQTAGLPWSGWRGRLLGFFLGVVLPRPAVTRLVGAVLRLYARLPFRDALRRLMPARLAAMEAMLPRPRLGESPLVPGVYSALGRRRLRVGFLTGCVMDTLMPHVNRATLRVLRRAGAEVVVPPAQGCCGALNVHNGDVERAMLMAARNIEAFERAGVERVVVNSAGCGSAMKEYGELLRFDRHYGKRARRFAEMVRDLSEVLVEMGAAEPVSRELRLTVTYQDPCHLVHAQRVSREPRSLLRCIPGVELREMKNPTRCCGSAGIYNVVEPEMAEKILAEKVRDVLSTGAEVVVAPNPGCMLQIASGLREAGSAVRVVHLAEILDWAGGDAADDEEGGYDER